MLSKVFAVSEFAQCRATQENMLHSNSIQRGLQFVNLNGFDTTASGRLSLRVRDSSRRSGEIVKKNNKKPHLQLRLRMRLLLLLLLLLFYYY